MFGATATRGKEDRRVVCGSLRCTSRLHRLAIQLPLQWGPRVWSSQARLAGLTIVARPSTTSFHSLQTGPGRCCIASPPGRPEVAAAAVAALSPWLPCALRTRMLQLALWPQTLRQACCSVCLHPRIAAEFMHRAGMHPPPLLLLPPSHPSPAAARAADGADNQAV